MKRFLVELLEGVDVVDKMELVAESWLDARKLAVREAAADVHRPKWPSDPLHRDIRASSAGEAKKRRGT
jgi:hypothetical protein